MTEGEYAKRLARYLQTIQDKVIEREYNPITEKLPKNEPTIEFGDALILHALGVKW